MTNAARGRYTWRPWTSLSANRAGSTTCASPSPTAATCAARTACRPRACRRARHDDILSYEELAAFARVAAGVRHQQGAHHRRRAAGPARLRRLRRHARPHQRHRRHLADHQRRAAAAVRRPSCARPGCGASTSASTASTRSASRASRAAAAWTTRSPASTPPSPPGSRRSRSTRCCCDGVEDELDAFVDLTREREVHVRFIEFMPLDRRVAGDDLGGEGRCCRPATSCASSWSATCCAARGPLRPRAGAVLAGRPARSAPSASSPASPSTSARAATACASRPTAACAPACSRATRSTSGRCIARPGELRAAIATAVAGKSFDRCREALANERAMSEIGG